MPTPGGAAVASAALQGGLIGWTSDEEAEPGVDEAYCAELEAELQARLAAEKEVDDAQRARMDAQFAAMNAGMAARETGSRAQTSQTCSASRGGEEARTRPDAPVRAMRTRLDQAVIPAQAGTHHALPLDSYNTPSIETASPPGRRGP